MQAELDQLCSFIHLFPLSMIMMNLIGRLAVTFHRVKWKHYISMTSQLELNPTKFSNNFVLKQTELQYKDIFGPVFIQLVEPHEAAHSNTMVLLGGGIVFTVFHWHTHP